MFIVIDRHHTRAYGPFLTREGAEDWLALQEIYTNHYYEQEVSICPLLPSSEKLQEYIPNI